MPDYRTENLHTLKYGHFACHAIFPLKTRHQNAVVCRLIGMTKYSAILKFDLFILLTHPLAWDISADRTKFLIPKYNSKKNLESMIKKCLAKNLNSKKKSKSMTQKSQVENHKLAHKVLDTKNLLVFVACVWLFFFYLGILYLFVLAHHPTGWRKLGIQIFGGDSRKRIFSSSSCLSNFNQRW